MSTIRSSALRTAVKAAAVVMAIAAVASMMPAQTPRPGAAPPTIQPKLALKDSTCRDQDDMCIWVHPTDPALSVIIASDKVADRLITYDLAGKTLESIPVDTPGNIDVRYGFPLSGGKVDVIAYNQRNEKRTRVCVYAIDPQTRKLRRVDDDRIVTGHNYGGTMYRSPKTGKFYFVTMAGVAEQYELYDDGAGKVAGRKVREWKTVYTEGAVGDDEAGMIYYGVESVGVYQVGGEPEDQTPGKLIAPVGENGLVADVEGIAIYHQPGGKGYLLVSSQGNSQFNVYQRGTGQYVGTFKLAGVASTDGVDVANMALGKGFPSGMFVCHADSAEQCPVTLTPWQDIACAFTPPLAIDTAWNPRKPEALAPKAPAGAAATTTSTVPTAPAPRRAGSLRQSAGHVIG